MRYATLLLCSLLMLLLAGCAGSQETAGISDTDAPMDSEAITVHTDMEGKEAYRKVAQVLQSRGYSLASTDETLMSISTEYRGFSEAFGVENLFAKVSASVRGEQDAKVALRGQWKDITDEGEDTGQTIKKYGMSTSSTRAAWKELHQVAEAVGDSLTYQ